MNFRMSAYSKVKTIKLDELLTVQLFLRFVIFKYYKSNSVMVAYLNRFNLNSSVILDPFDSQTLDRGRLPARSGPLK